MHSCTAHVLVITLCTAALACQTKGDPSASETSTDDAASTTDEPFDYDAYEAQCAAQTDPASCEAVPSPIEQFGAGAGAPYCAWQVWTNTTLAPDGTCSFSETEASCVMTVNGDGCWGAQRCLDGHAAGGFRYDGRTVQIGFANWCGGPPYNRQCEAGADGTLYSGPPECACLCDPSWPGP
jgi:hypothetical protein